MLAAAEARSIDAIVTWHNDRLHRSPKELESFIDLVERSGVRLAVVTGGDYDLTTPDGRLSARIVGAVARKESEDRSRRVRRKHLELAEQGKPGGQLGWGVRTEEERRLVSEAVERVLDGQGLMRIASDWNNGGVPSSSGRPWRASTLRRVLLAPRIAGLREHGAEPSGRSLGELTPAVWQGAVERTTWEQVRAVLLSPERVTGASAAPRYLLTGLADCGVCGSALFARPRSDGTKRYVCAGRRSGHQLTVVAEPLDHFVAGCALDLLSSASFRQALLEQGSGADEGMLGGRLAALGAAEVRLRSLDEDYYVRGELTKGRHRSMKSKLEREIRELHNLVEAAIKRRVVLHPDPRALWNESDIGRKRELVRLAVRRVIVQPASQMARRFDPGRIEIVTTVEHPISTPKSSEALELFLVKEIAPHCGPATLPATSR